MKEKRTEKVLALGVTAIVIAALGFGGGIVYQKGKQSSNDAPVARGANDSNFRASFNGPRGTMGTVTAVSSTGISLEDSRSGTASTLEITDATKVTNEGQTASISDVKVGDTVMVQSDSTNAKQAAQISLNPQMPTMGNRPGATN